MRMLEVQNPDDINIQDVLSFLTIYILIFFCRSAENFFFTRISTFCDIQVLNIYTYATNTCMLKTQVTIYHFIGNIDDKKNL